MADTTFHGWTVTSDEDANQVVFTKPDENADGGQRRVMVRGGADTPHAIVRATGARNALASDLEVSSEDDKSLWQDRHAAAANHLKKLHAEERRRLEGEQEPTPPGGIDAIIDMPTMTIRGGAIAPEGSN